MTYDLLADTANVPVPNRELLPRLRMLGGLAILLLKLLDVRALEALVV